MPFTIMDLEVPRKWITEMVEDSAGYVTKPCAKDSIPAATAFLQKLDIH